MQCGNHMGRWRSGAASLFHFRSTRSLTAYQLHKVQILFEIGGAGYIQTISQCHRKHLPCQDSPASLPPLVMNLRGRTPFTLKQRLGTRNVQLPFLLRPTHTPLLLTLGRLGCPLQPITSTHLRGQLHLQLSQHVPRQAASPVTFPGCLSSGRS